MLRRLAPLVLLVALVAACGATSVDAATAGSASISEKSLRDELKVTRDNKAYLAIVEQQYQQSKLTGDAEGTFNSKFVAQLLSFRIYYSLIEQRLKADGISIDNDDLKAAHDSIDKLIQAIGTKAKLPKSYQDTLVHREALVNATSRAALKFYAKTAKVACVSHILVDSKQKADDLKAQLDNGADFAALAKANSNDSSKDQGGDLGCQPPGTYVQEFEDAVQSLPIGKVSAPVHTQFGWHLVLVRERRQATTEELAAADQQAQQAYFLDIVCKHAAVHVNPSYGRWDTSPCKGGQGLAQVSPPAGPAPGK